MPKEVIHPSTPLPEGQDVYMTAEVGWQPDCWVQLRMAVDRKNTGDVYAADLDRQQINKLIRVLRRARDQAYGRDE